MQNFFLGFLPIKHFPLLKPYVVLVIWKIGRCRDVLLSSSILRIIRPIYFERGIKY